MNVGQFGEIFSPWFDVVINEFANTIAKDYDKDTLAFLHKNIEREIKHVYFTTDRYTRTQALYNALSHLYEHLNWKLRKEDDFPNVTWSCVILLSQLIKTGLLLTQGLTNCKWMDRTLTALKLFTGKPSLLYDALLLVNGLKRIHHKPYSIILKCILKTDYKEITDPLLYMEIILLCRRLRALCVSKNITQYSLATKIKPPSNLISWLASLNVNGSVSFLKILKHKKIAQQLMRKSIPDLLVRTLRDLILRRYYFEKCSNMYEEVDISEKPPALFVTDSSSTYDNYCSEIRPIDSSSKRLNLKKTNKVKKGKKKKFSTLNKNKKAVLSNVRATKSTSPAESGGQVSFINNYSNLVVDNDGIESLQENVKCNLYIPLNSVSGTSESNSVNTEECRKSTKKRRKLKATHHIPQNEELRTNNGIDVIDTDDVPSKRTKKNNLFENLSHSHISAKRSYIENTELAHDDENYSSNKCRKKIKYSLDDEILKAYKYVYENSCLSQSTTFKTINVAPENTIKKSSNKDLDNSSVEDGVSLVSEITSNKSGVSELDVKEILKDSDSLSENISVSNTSQVNKNNIPSKDSNIDFLKQQLDDDTSQCDKLKVTSDSTCNTDMCQSNVDLILLKCSGKVIDKNDIRSGFDISNSDNKNNDISKLVEKETDKNHFDLSNGNSISSNTSELIIKSNLKYENAKEGIPVSTSINTNSILVSLDSNDVTKHIYSDKLSSKNVDPEVIELDIECKGTENKINKDDSVQEISENFKPKSKKVSVLFVESNLSTKYSNTDKVAGKINLTLSSNMVDRREDILQEVSLKQDIAPTANVLASDSNSSEDLLSKDGGLVNLYNESTNKKKMKCKGSGSKIPIGELVTSENIKPKHDPMSNEVSKNIVKSFDADKSMEEASVCIESNLMNRSILQEIKGKTVESCSNTSSEKEISSFANIPQSCSELSDVLNSKVKNKSLKKKIESSIMDENAKDNCIPTESTPMYPDNVVSSVSLKNYENTSKTITSTSESTSINTNSILVSSDDSYSKQVYFVKLPSKNINQEVIDLDIACKDTKKKINIHDDSEQEISENFKPESNFSAELSDINKVAGEISIPFSSDVLNRREDIFQKVSLKQDIAPKANVLESHSKSSEDLLSKEGDLVNLHNKSTNKKKTEINMECKGSGSKIPIGDLVNFENIEPNHDPISNEVSKNIAKSFDADKSMEEASVFIENSLVNTSILQEMTDKAVEICSNPSSEKKISSFANMPQSCSELSDVLNSKCKDSDNLFINNTYEKTLGIDTKCVDFKIDMKESMENSSSENSESKVKYSPLPLKKILQSSIMNESAKDNCIPTEGTPVYSDNVVSSVSLKNDKNTSKRITSSSESTSINTNSILVSSDSNDISKQVYSDKLPSKNMNQDVIELDKECKDAENKINIEDDSVQEISENFKPESKSVPVLFVESNLSTKYSDTDMVAGKISIPLSSDILDRREDILQEVFLKQDIAAMANVLESHSKSSKDLLSKDGGLVNLCNQSTSKKKMEINKECKGTRSKIEIGELVNSENIEPDHNPMSNEVSKNVAKCLDVDKSMEEASICIENSLMKIVCMNILQEIKDKAVESCSNPSSEKEISSFANMPQSCLESSDTLNSKGKGSDNLLVNNANGKTIGINMKCVDFKIDMIESMENSSSENSESEVKCSPKPLKKFFESSIIDENTKDNCIPTEGTPMYSDNIVSSVSLKNDENTSKTIASTSETSLQKSKDSSFKNSLFIKLVRNLDNQASDFASLNVKDVCQNSSDEKEPICIVELEKKKIENKLICNENNSDIEKLDSTDSEKAIESVRKKTDISCDKKLVEGSIPENNCDIPSFSHKVEIKHTSDNSKHPVSATVNYSNKIDLLSGNSKNIESPPTTDKTLFGSEIDSEDIDVVNDSNDDELFSEANNTKNESVYDYVVNVIKKDAGSVIENKTMCEPLIIKLKDPKNCKQHEEKSLLKEISKVLHSDNTPYFCKNKDYMSFSDISMLNKNRNIVVNSVVKNLNPITNFSSAATTEIFCMYRNDILHEDKIDTLSRDDVSSNIHELSSDVTKSPSVSSNASDEDYQHCSSDDEDPMIDEAQKVSNRCQNKVPLKTTNSVALLKVNVDCSMKKNEMDDISDYCSPDKNTVNNTEESYDSNSLLLKESKSIEESIPNKEDNPIEKVLPRQSLRIRNKVEVNKGNSEENSESDIRVPQKGSKSQAEITDVITPKNSSPKIDNASCLELNFPSSNFAKDVNMSHKKCPSSHKPLPKRYRPVIKSKSKENTKICSIPSKGYSLRHRKSGQLMDDSSNLGIDLTKLHLDSPSCSKNTRSKSTRDSKFAKLLSLEITSPDRSAALSDLILSTKRETRSSTAKTEQESTQNTPGYNLRTRKSIICPGKLNI